MCAYDTNCVAVSVTDEIIHACDAISLTFFIKASFFKKMDTRNPRILVRKQAYSFDHRPYVVDTPPSNQRQDENFLVPNSAVLTSHVVSQNRRAMEAPPNTEVNACTPNQIDDFGGLSRAGLEVYAHTKTFEANSFKVYLKESEMRCKILQTSLNEMRDLANKYNVLQTSFDEMKAKYAHTQRKHADLKRHCNQFISDVQRDDFDDVDGVR